MGRRLLFTFTVFVTVCSSCACLAGFMPRECREFFDLPSSERETKFRQYPVEKQVDLYLCGMNQEPPESGYAAYIAEGGEQVIPYLLERLKREELEINQTRIMDVFTVLAVKGHLRGRKDVIVELEGVVAKMKYQPMKLKAQRYLELIDKYNKGGAP